MSDIRSQTFDIADTATTSSVVKKAHLDLLGLITPTAVTVDIYGCDTEDGTYGIVQDTDGNDLSAIALEANKPRGISLTATQAARFLKLEASVGVTGDLSVRPVFRDLR